MSSKLSLFTEYFPYNKGEFFLKNEIQYLSQHFEEVTIFPLYFNENEKKNELPDNVKVVHFNAFSPYSRPKTLFKNFFTVLKIFLAELFNSSNRSNYIVHFKKELNNLLHKIAHAEKLALVLNAHNIETNNCYTYWFNQWTFILCVMKLKKKNLSITTRVHGGDLYEYQHYEQDFYFPFRAFQMNYIDTIVPISNDGKMHLKKTRPNYYHKIIVSRLGVNDNGINPYNPENRFTIISCSGIQRYKRIHLIIEILKNLSFEIEWIHIGDGELKSEIEKQVSHLPPHVTAKLAGHMTNEEVLSFYQKKSIDLFINVSESEGIPVSIMEAISFGIPVVATNVGGVAEIVNAETGFLIDKSFDPTSVANIIVDYKNQTTDVLRKKRNSTRQFWLKNYVARDNYSSFIENVLLK